MVCTLALIAAVLAGAGCGGSQSTGGGSDKTPYDFQKEGQVPPLEEAQIHEEPDVEEMPLEEVDLEVREAEAKVDTTARPEPPATIDGFRVQVFASVSRDTAENARKAAEERLGMRAYVDFVDAMYKVRVGDCRTREAAETVLRRCQESVYKDAWIVACPVLLEQLGPAE
jgi:hypothetical protein